MKINSTIKVLHFQLTCDKIAKVPGVVMENGFEILDKLLHDGLLHHAVIVLGVLGDHHLHQDQHDHL